MRKRFIFFALAVGGAMALFLLLPLDIPYEVVAYGKIMPSKGWVLSKGEEGQLIASSFNYETGVTEGYSVSQFERGAEMHFTLHPALTAAGVVAAGDTIGTLYDSKLEERLVQCKGELAIAQATLGSDAVGEKIAVVREAQQRLTHAHAEAAEQKKIVTRLQHLFEKGLMAEEEFEIADSKANLLDIEVSIAESQLEASQTGAKPHYIKLLQTQIEALQQEIEVLERRYASLTITSPIEGKVARTFSSDTLLVIADTSAYVAFMVIKWKDVPYLKEAHAVRIYPRGLPQTTEGHLASLDKEVHLINGEQVLVAVAVLRDLSGEILPGMIAQCVIACKPVTPLEYVRRFFNTMMA